ncbi:MAG: cysteine peptidase family C39 domain-containing protein [Kiritimatiellia bacterium]
MLIAVLLFVAGLRFQGRITSGRHRLALSALAVLLAVPGVLIALYYLHLFDNAAWFYEFRSLRFSELSAGGCGLLAGLLAAAGRDVFVAALLLIGLMVGIVLPHSKPLYGPLQPGDFKDARKDAVCLQSTGCSCGAASAATLLRQAGIPATEAEVARACFTYEGGTENWYLARHLRSRGLRVRFITRLDPSAPLPVPSIAGVLLGKVGHFIPILANTETTYITGDPLHGREEWAKDLIREHYTFTGFFMTVEGGHGPP